MKQYFEVEIEETTVKTYKIEIGVRSVNETLQYIADNLYHLEQMHNPHGETSKIEALAIYLREDRP
jgi:hypothetical protein